MSPRPGTFSYYLDIATAIVLGGGLALLIVGESFLAIAGFLIEVVGVAYPVNILVAFVATAAGAYFYIRARPWRNS